MIKQCAECQQPAVGRLANVGAEDEPEYLLCAECLLKARREGNAVAQLEPRQDLVARVRASISGRLYDQSTVEGQLALNLAVDKLQEQKRQAGTRPRCSWDGHPCALQNCAENGCYLDSRYQQMTGDDPKALRCGVPMYETPTSIRCGLIPGHPGLHRRGWGPGADRWEATKP